MYRIFKEIDKWIFSKFNLTLIILIFLSGCKVGENDKVEDLKDLSGVWKLTVTSGENTCGDPEGQVMNDRIVLFQCGKELQIIMLDGIWATGIIDGDVIEMTTTENGDDNGCLYTNIISGSMSGTNELLTGSFTTEKEYNPNPCGDKSNCTSETNIRLEIESYYSETCLGRDDFGDPAESEYILPYPTGKSYRNNNTYCLPSGHREQQAYDFLIPIGETIIAARGGIVRQIKESSPDNGQGTDHNHVMIEHSDGTVGFYAHLMQNGVMVNVGDTVEQGDVIALAGHSGTPDVAHLHFGVYDNWPPQEGQDQAINFSNTDGQLDCIGGLVQAAMYTAQ